MRHSNGRLHGGAAASGDNRQGMSARSEATVDADEVGSSRALLRALLREEERVGAPGQEQARAGADRIPGHVAPGGIAGTRQVGELLGDPGSQGQAGAGGQARLAPVEEGAAQGVASSGEGRARAEVQGLVPPEPGIGVGVRGGGEREEQDRREEPDGGAHADTLRAGTAQVKHASTEPAPRPPSPPPPPAPAERAGERPEFGAQEAERYPRAMKISALDVQQKEFSRAFRGFRREEVTAFLAEVAQELEALARRNIELEEDLRRRDEHIAELLAQKKLVEETLVTAQRLSDRVGEQATREAERIIADAERQGERILNEANERLAKVIGQITEMKRERTLFASQLRQAAEAQLALLDSLDPDTDSLAPDNVELLRRVSGSKD